MGGVLKHHIKVVHESHRQHREERCLKIGTSPKFGSRRRGVRVSRAVFSSRRSSSCVGVWLHRWPLDSSTLVAGRRQTLPPRDFSRVTWLYLMKSCSNFFSHFNTFCADIQIQFHVSVQILRSDKANEYFSKPF